MCSLQMGRPFYLNWGQSVQRTPESPQLGEKCVWKECRTQWTSLYLQEKTRLVLRGAGWPSLLGKYWWTQRLAHFSKYQIYNLTKPSWYVVFVNYLWTPPLNGIAVCTVYDNPLCQHNVYQLVFLLTMSWTYMCAHTHTWIYTHARMQLLENSSRITLDVSQCHPGYAFNLTSSVCDCRKGESYEYNQIGCERNGRYIYVPVSTSSHGQEVV